MGIAYLELGKLYIDQLNQANKGLTFLKQGKHIYEALVNQHPQYADFKKNYDWVLRKIESLA